MITTISFVLISILFISCLSETEDLKAGAEFSFYQIFNLIVCQLLAVSLLAIKCL